MRQKQLQEDGFVLAQFEGTVGSGWEAWRQEGAAASIPHPSIRKQKETNAAALPAPVWNPNHGRELPTSEVGVPISFTPLWNTHTPQSVSPEYTSKFREVDSQD